VFLLRQQGENILQITGLTTVRTELLHTYSVAPGMLSDLLLNLSGFANT